MPVHDTYQSKAYPEIYAVGIAAAVAVPWITPIAVGVPKTGFPTEIQAKVAAHKYFLWKSRNGYVKLP